MRAYNANETSKSRGWFSHYLENFTTHSERSEARSIWLASFAIESQG
jgi:hypothetical protein